MLTLGLPTTAVAAVMLAAFQQYGIQPGPLLFEREPDLVWGLIASLFIGMVLLLVLNLPLAPVWAKLLRIPRPYLYAGILFFAARRRVRGRRRAARPGDPAGHRAASGSRCAATACRCCPAIIGVILGPAAEQQLRRALQISDGSVTRPGQHPVLGDRLRGDRRAAGLALAASADRTGHSPRAGTTPRTPARNPGRARRKARSEGTPHSSPC